jgi:hypothetical protein
LCRLTMKLRHPAGNTRTHWSSRKRCASSGLSVAPGWAALVSSRVCADLIPLLTTIPGQPVESPVTFKDRTSLKTIRDRTLMYARVSHASMRIVDLLVLVSNLRLVPQHSGRYEVGRRGGRQYHGRTKSVRVTLRRQWRHLSDLLDAPHQRHETLNALGERDDLPLRRGARGEEVLLARRKI